MKTTILLVRHGQSEANLEGVFAGHTGHPLTPLGHEQAERAAKYIKETYAVDTVYSSDLPRAFQTADHIARAFSLPVITNAQFREINGGAWENVPYSELLKVFPEDFGLWSRDIGNATCTDGEAVLSVANRVYQAMIDVAEANPGKCIVVASHATPIRSSLWKISGRDVSAMQSSTWVGNCGISELLYEGGTLKLVKENYTGHLVGVETNLPKDV